MPKVERRSEPTPFLKFLVIGQIGFGHNTQDFPFLKSDSGINQPVFRPERYTDNRQQRQFARIGNQLNQCPLRIIEQRLLRKQIKTSISGDSQFGKSNDLYAFRYCLPHQSGYSFDIIKTICNPHMWHGRSDFDKSVIHIFFFNREQK